MVLLILQAKLRALREYVRDLQSSYEELLDTFAQLENAARDRVASLEQQLADQAKVRLVTVFGSFLFICKFFSSSVILQKFQRRHELLEQEIASLRAGTKSCPIDQQTQTDVQSVLDEVEQDTAGVLATVDGLCTGVMKVSPQPSTPLTACTRL